MPPPPPVSMAGAGMGGIPTSRPWSGDQRQQKPSPRQLDPETLRLLQLKQQLLQQGRALAEGLHCVLCCGGRFSWSVPGYYVKRTRSPHIVLRIVGGIICFLRIVGRKLLYCAGWVCRLLFNSLCNALLSCLTNLVSYTEYAGGMLIGKRRPLYNESEIKRFRQFYGPPCIIYWSMTNKTKSSNKTKSVFYIPNQLI